MTEPCFVYIFHSDTSHRYYVGSSNDPHRRLIQHNDPDYHGIRTTKVWKGPWELI